MASLVNDEAADLTLVALLAESPGKNQVRKYVSCDDLPRGARSGDRAEVRLLSRTCKCSGIGVVSLRLPKDADAVTLKGALSVYSITDCENQ